MNDKNIHGFSLIEMSIVLVLLSLVAGSGLHALQFHLQHKREALTQKRLKDAREALLHYIHVHGYLPCPAVDIDLQIRQPLGGWEKRHTGGRCLSYDGFLPALSLGLVETDQQGYLVDGWERRSNRIRYAVAQLSFASTDVSLVEVKGQGCGPHDQGAADTSHGIIGSARGALHNQFWGILPYSQPLKRFGLCVCSRAKCADSLGAPAAAVIYSLGENAYMNAHTSEHSDEKENINQDRFFVEHVPTIGFDDYVTWISSEAFWGALADTGRLREPAPAP